MAFVGTKERYSVFNKLKLMRKIRFPTGRAYKARLQWGAPAVEGGDGALTKHACSWGAPAVEGGDGSLTKHACSWGAPAVEGGDGALTKHACS